MAMLAERVASAPPDTRGLLHAGAAILGVAFLVKAAAWPMGFWLPGAYDAASPPVATMLRMPMTMGYMSSDVVIKSGHRYWFQP